jgi:hypothetical protein
MENAAHNVVAGWETFYVIVGSAAAALTGLQFVVMAIVADGLGRNRTASESEIDAFGTPNIVHFCASLLVAAILATPWQRLSSIGITLGLCGITGIIYGFIVFKRARQQTGYQPVLEDWIWHSILPMVAYAGLLTAGLGMTRYTAPLLFLVGFVDLLLLFIGIHNSWDTVTYITLQRLKDQKSEVR